MMKAFLIVKVANNNWKLVVRAKYHIPIWLYLYPLISELKIVNFVFIYFSLIFFVSSTFFIKNLVSELWTLDLNLFYFSFLFFFSFFYLILNSFFFFFFFYFRLRQESMMWSHMWWSHKSQSQDTWLHNTKKGIKDSEIGDII